MSTRPKAWSFKEFRRHPKIRDNPIAAEMADAGEDGWLKRLSQLRNDVVHVAPIGAHHSFPSCSTRGISLPDGGRVLFLSYGLLDRTTVKSSANDSIIADDEESIKAELLFYRSQLEVCDDALEYTWITLGQLVSLCESARLASGLKGEMPTITDKDIIGVKMITD